MSNTLVLWKVGAVGIFFNDRKGYVRNGGRKVYSVYGQWFVRR